MTNITARPIRPTFKPKEHYSDATNEKLRAAHEAGCDYYESMECKDYTLLPHYIIGYLSTIIDMNIE
jgi:hypothetical protein